MAWTYTNVPDTGTAQSIGSVAANYNQLTTAQGLAGRTVIVSVVKDSGDATEAELLSVIRALEQAGGDHSGTDTNGPDAFVVAGISGTIGTDPVYLALQCTGTVPTAPVSGFTVAVVANFVSPV